MDKVFIVLDDSKACYDAGGIFYSAHATLEEAQDEINRFGECDRQIFTIEEIDL